MQFLLLALLLFLARIISCVSVRRDRDALGPNVTLSTGAISGSPRDANGILAFKGIPYAAPPVGELRWRPPKRPLHWDGVLDATQFGPFCWQAFAPPGTPPQSEDCLKINIWTGAAEKTEKRPIMLWIHGGGFEFGSSLDPRYDGAHMATKGVIVASINYRLGAFGYLALPQLDHGGRKSGNFGLQDMIAALKWIRTHIHDFGGDPDKITLWGESGGAHAVGLLMTSPLAKGLFQQAIMESGAFWESEHGEPSSFEQARQLGKIFTQRVNVTSEEDLLALPAKVVNQAGQWNVATDPGITAYSPSIDNYVLTDVPANVFKTGKQLKIPVLAGINAKEELVFASRALPTPNLTAYLSEAELVFRSQTPKFLSLYPADNLTEATASSLALDGDLIIREQTWEAIDYTHLNADAQPVWAYYFTYTSAYSPAPIHTAELPFVFGNLVPGDSGNSATAADVAFSDTLVAYWSNFAKTGNPNGVGLPTWPAYEHVGAGGGQFLQLGNVIGGYVYDLGRFRFIQGLRDGDQALPGWWRGLPIPGY